ncbi:MAG: slipin family protein [Candidatus Pseudobacter hemicellulosilyticus]|uniref:Slipin family protein n=1 Tax=Candidatus Pseudobacter hemicellulosilyticus TaxID=3121375 RepID=A0AAJ5WTD7_9BACT|nr:MAG: slipin family protein [Pseudobacter sp.]
MKRVKINAYQAGLVFKDGTYQKLLRQGTYWFWHGEAVGIHELTQPFRPPVELNILLQDPELASLLHVVEVRDNEIALQFQEDILKGVLTPGRYAFWVGPVQYRFIKADTSKINITEPLDKAMLHHKLLASFVRSVTVEAGQQAMLYVDGKPEKVLDPGVYHFWKNGIAVSIISADLRQQQLEINGQEILTRDKASLRINAWAQFRVTDVEKALLHNKEYERQLYVSLQLALREYVAGLSLDELLEKKDAIGAFIVEQVKRVAAGLGTAVLAFGIRDIILPGDMKEIMNQVLVAEKKAQANSIMRREETASTRSLLNTARLMEENSMLWKLKEMEYVEKIAEKISHISLNGNDSLLLQLKQLFATRP